MTPYTTAEPTPLSTLPCSSHPSLLTFVVHLILTRTLTLGLRLILVKL